MQALAKLAIGLLLATLATEALLAQVFVGGYTRKDGTYVAPHMRSSPNGTPTDNWSIKGNVNPYTGVPGKKNLPTPYLFTPPAPAATYWPAPSRYFYAPPAPATTNEPVPNNYKAPAGDKTDAQFRALFDSWKRLDQLEEVMTAIPSAKPVSKAVSISRGYGTSASGTGAFHNGVDIVGPVGAPVYATAEGVVARTGIVEDYGKLVEVDHGKGIITRYGNLSLVTAVTNRRVVRGELIGLMGPARNATGGSLHYEVRLDGHSVDPTPFLRTDSYLAEMKQAASSAETKLMSDVSRAILEGRCEDAKKIALANARIDVADQADRLCEPPSQTPATGK